MLSVQCLVFTVYSVVFQVAGFESRVQGLVLVCSVHYLLFSVEC